MIDLSGLDSVTSFEFAPQTDGLTIGLALALAFMVGCVFGSFLNVVIWRVPNHISLVDPSRSFCPNCRTPIAGYDNIPLVSYLVLRGRCRHCGQPISARYPTVEALGGVAAVLATAGALYGGYPAWALPALYLLAAVSIVVAFIDLDHHLILDIVIYPSAAAMLLLLVLASGMGSDWNRLLHAVVGAVVLGLFYLALALLWPGGMGLGDVKLAVLLGLVLGWLGWPQFVVGAFAAFLLGGVVSIIMVAARKVDIHGGIPFGPHMVVGAWIGILVGVPLARLYLRTAGLG